MRNRVLYILVFWDVLSVSGSWAIENRMAQVFVGQDLHISGRELVSHRPGTGEHVLVFPDGFSMSIGANQFSSGSAVVWLESLSRQWRKFEDKEGLGYKAIVYLRDNVSVSKAPGARTTDLGQVQVEAGAAQLVVFGVSGEVFVTAEKREVAEPNGLELYRKAVAALQTAGVGLRIVEESKLPAELLTPERPTEVRPGEPKFRYPINIAPAGAEPVELDTAPSGDRTDIATVTNRFYIWQKQDEKGGLLELQADNAVIFLGEELKPGDKQPAGSETPTSPQPPGAPGGEDKQQSERRLTAMTDDSPQDALPPRQTTKQAAAQDILAKGAVKGIYLSGDVGMTEGQRTIRADEIYYDFERKKAVIKNATMRTFDVGEGIPIYVRAEELRQEAENEFAAENITLTTDEFYRPQISLSASAVAITDTTGVGEQQVEPPRSSYDARMHDVRFNVYDRTIFYLPYVRSNLQRPDIPFKSAHFGHNSTWGTLLETRWYLARMLGLQEPEGTESTFALDYYGKRGVGAGVEIEYERQNYFGRMLGYVIDDSGKDRLGRHVSRKHLEPERELRGRFLWRHRHFLPFNWQLTGEISYASDRNFIESFYRGEFHTGKEQETLLHLKRIEDNWGLSFLTKVRINDFVNQLEELPTGEFHWTGQSFFDDRLTFYSDTQVSRFRQRYASSDSTPGPEQFYSFAMTRNEVDMPFSLGRTKVVPFVAGTAAYEDRFGFFRELDGGTAASRDDLWYGEVGVRVSQQPYWKVFGDVKSRLWDINQLRHIVRPYLTAVGYTQSDSVIEQRDVLNVGIAQRLQTRRGTPDRERTVDWMRLNTDFTWVNDSSDASSGADRFIWNKPFIPTINTYDSAVPGVLQQDRRATSIYGPRRNYFGADYSWRLSDTTAVLSDLNYDMQSGVVQQFNVGFSHLRWPDLSYYIGSRYLRRIEITDPDVAGLTLQKGSNAFIFAITYVLDPRYTMVFSNQLDFDYGATVRSDITLIRRYRRIYWGLTFSVDESLDEQSIVFSIWPQGVPDLGIGPRRYMGLGGSAGY